jgi:ElaB/YqjD/DUF883 family membrane-anchored ribosome-binding protein
MEPNLDREKEAASAETGQQSKATAAQRAREQVSDVVEQAKQTVSSAYGKTAETLSQTYNQAIRYGRENPGTTALIAFGAGVGIGLLLAGVVMPRNRYSRIVPRVVDALSDIALELFT